MMDLKPVAEKMPWWACYLMAMLFLLMADSEAAKGSDIRALIDIILGAVIAAFGWARQNFPEVHHQGSTKEKTE